jgi:hypothetical protein
MAQMETGAHQVVVAERILNIEDSEVKVSPSWMIHFWGMNATD